MRPWTTGQLNELMASYLQRLIDREEKPGVYMYTLLCELTIVNGIQMCSKMCETYYFLVDFQSRRQRI